MFVQDQQKSWVDARPESVAYLASSVNRPVVVLTGKPPQPAQAYVGIVHTAKGYDIYVYLHCIHSNEGLLFGWDMGTVSKDNAAAVQKEAIGFAESMGFMMSDLRWREQDAQGRTDMFNSVPMFFQDLSRFKEQVEEEILEIEPAEEEIVVERVEEPVETVTEGDFVIHEEAFAEPGQSQQAEPMPLGELPDLAPGAGAQVQAEPAPAELSEEDILLEGLEMKDEPVPAQVQAATEAPAEAQPAAPSKGLIIEIEEHPVEEMPEPVPAEEIKAEVEEQARPAPEPTVEEIALGTGAELGPFEPGPAEPVEEPQEEEEIIIGPETAAPAKAAPEPGPEPRPQPAISEPVPEILMEGEEIQIPILEEPAPKPVPEAAAAAPSAVVQPEAEPEPAPAAEPVPAPIIEQESIQEQPVVQSTEAGGEPGQEDLALAVRFLAMF